MSFTKVHPELSGHSVLLIESPTIAGELYAHLLVIENMKVEAIHNFPRHLLSVLQRMEMESAIIHVPGTTTNQETYYERNIYEAIDNGRRIVLLSGGGNVETLAMYDRLRNRRVPMVEKRVGLMFAEVVDLLATQFKIGS